MDGLDVVLTGSETDDSSFSVSQQSVGYGVTSGYSSAATGRSRRGFRARVTHMVGNLGQHLASGLGAAGPALSEQVAQDFAVNSTEVAASTLVAAAVRNLQNEKQTDFEDAANMPGFESLSDDSPPHFLHFREVATYPEGVADTTDLSDTGVDSSEDDDGDGSDGNDSEGSDEPGLAGESATEGRDVVLRNRSSDSRARPIWEFEPASSDDDDSDSGSASDTSAASPSELITDFGESAAEVLRAPRGLPKWRSGGMSQAEAPSDLTEFESVGIPSRFRHRRAQRQLRFKPRGSGRRPRLANSESSFDGPVRSTRQEQPEIGSGDGTSIFSEQAFGMAHGNGPLPVFPTGITTVHVIEDDVGNGAHNEDEAADLQLRPHHFLTLHSLATAASERAVEETEKMRLSSDGNTRRIHRHAPKNESDVDSVVSVSVFSDASPVVQLENSEFEEGDEPVLLDMAIISPISKLAGRLAIAGQAETQLDTVPVVALPLDAAKDAIARLRKEGSSNVLYLALVFLILWIGFNGVQGLIVSFDKELGSLVLATYYGANVAFAPFVVFTLSRVQLTNIFRASFPVYVLWIASLIYPITPIILGVTACLGVAGALLWPAQGVYVGQNSDETTSFTNNGLFLAIFQGNMIISSVGGSLILGATNGDFAVVFSVFCAVAAVSAALIFKAKLPSFSAVHDDGGDMLAHPPERWKDLDVEDLLEIDVDKAERSLIAETGAVLLHLSEGVVDGFVKQADADIKAINALRQQEVLTDADNSTDGDDVGMFVSEAETANEENRTLISEVSGRSVGAASSAHSIAVTVTDIPADKKAGAVSLKSAFIAFFKVFADPHARYLIPAFLLHGFFFAFMFGPLVTLLPSAMIGYGIAIFGVFSIASALAAGKTSMGAVLRLAIATGLFLIGIAFTLVGFFELAAASDPEARKNSVSHVFVLYLALGLFGLADGFGNASISAVVPRACPHDVTSGYSLYRVLQNGGMAVMNLLFGFGLETPYLAGGIVITVVVSGVSIWRLRQVCDV